MRMQRLKIQQNLPKITQVATNKFYALKNPFQHVSSPQRGDMSIENGIFNLLHSVGVLCL
jgi:hypothetical protein